MKKNISCKRKSKSKQNLKYKGGGIFSGLKKIEQLDQAVKATLRGKPSSEEKREKKRRRSRRK